MALPIHSYVEQECDLLLAGMIQTVVDNPTEDKLIQDIVKSSRLCYSTVVKHPENNELPIIPDELAKYVSPTDIITNAQNYREMQKEYTPGQLLAIQAIKDSLLDIELTHTTQAHVPFAVFREQGILPESHLPTASKHTFPLDRSLGLNQYAFMNWGEFNPEDADEDEEYKSPYGSKVIGLNPKQILSSPRTIVTPNDIHYSMKNDMERTADELVDPGSGTVPFDRYLAEIVRGQDWLEIVGRKVLDNIMWQDKTTNDPKFADFGLPPVTVYKHPTHAWPLGEIKHFGPVAPTAITSTAENPEEFHAKWKHMVEKHGFAPGHIAASVEYDHSEVKDEMDIDTSKPRERWREILELARSSDDKPSKH